MRLVRTEDWVGLLGSDGPRLGEPNNTASSAPVIASVSNLPVEAELSEVSAFSVQRSNHMVGQLTRTPRFGTLVALAIQ